MIPKLIRLLTCWSGRQDLNLRLPGPERQSGSWDGVALSGTASHQLDITEDSDPAHPLNGRRDRPICPHCVPAFSGKTRLAGTTFERSRSRGAAQHLARFTLQAVRPKPGRPCSGGERNPFRTRGHLSVRPRTPQPILTGVLGSAAGDDRQLPLRPSGASSNRHPRAARSLIYGNPCYELRRHPRQRVRSRALHRLRRRVARRLLL